jgi:membrane-bound lytic murein transglycosylase D
MTGLRVLILLIVAMLAGCATQSGQMAGAGSGLHASMTSRTIDLTHPPRDMWERIRRGFTIPNYNSELTDYWTQYYASHPESVFLMSQRASKYLYHIVGELNRRSMPTELALLPFVESAYNPAAMSRSQASGLWQFIPSTGRHFNLRQDWWRDDRRDPIASTNAALDYFNYLYDFQGDWYLALASYNWGEGAVRRAMDRNASAGLPTDYASLKLPDETRNYIPKLQAIKNIISNPKKYGITLPPVRNTPYFTTVKKSRTIDIDVAAQLAEMSVDDFRALNAAFNQPVIVAEHNPVLIIPTDRLAVFQENLANYDGPLSSWKTYQPVQGESLASIAKKYGTTLAKLREANGLSRRQTVATSQPLLVPNGQTPGDNENNGGIRLASYQEQPALRIVPDRATDIRVLRRSPNVRTHTVRQGDTLYSLAKRYNTSITELRRLNNLSGSRLSTGKKLRVPGTDVRG